MYDLQSVLHPSSIYGTELPWTVFGSTARPMWTDPSTDSMAESMSEGLTSSESGTSVLAEHLAVMDLVDPGHHLGSEEMHEDGEYTSFESMMRDREVRNSLESQAEWEELLAKMGHKSGSSQGGSRAQDLSTLNEGQALEVKDAISDLFTTLRRIDATPRSQRTREARQVDVLDHDGQYVEITNDDGGSDVVLLRTGQNGERRYKLLGEDGEAQDYEMLSTVRKRRKKIKKHKYKKRRKVCTSFVCSLRQPWVSLRAFHIPIHGCLADPGNSGSTVTEEASRKVMMITARTAFCITDTDHTSV